MSRQKRWCRRCRATALHVVDDDPPRLAWRWLLLWPVEWLLWRLLCRPLCLACLRRDADDQGDVG